MRDKYEIINHVERDLSSLLYRLPMLITPTVKTPLSALQKALPFPSSSQWITLLMASLLFINGSTKRSLSWKITRKRVFTGICISLRNMGYPMRWREVLCRQWRKWWWASCWWLWCWCFHCMRIPTGSVFNCVSWPIIVITFPIANESLCNI